jgi:hypothetical protein
LWLYIDVSQLTRWRLATVIWLFLVAFGFVTLIRKITADRTAAWLWRTNALNLFVTLYVCAFFNFSGFIADVNVRHCREAGGSGMPLDTAYLVHLGPPALPAIEWVRPRLPLEERFALSQDELRLDADLRAKLADWRGWTYRRQRIAQNTSAESPPLKFSLAPMK